MKKLQAFIFSFFLMVTVARSQSVYELSFTFPEAANAVTFKACYTDAADGKGKLRLRFAAPGIPDSILAELDAVEELPDLNSGCINSNRVYYKLQNPNYIESKDPGIIFPKYFFFQKDTATGFFEPYGITNSSVECNAEPVKFSSTRFIDQQSLTKEFVLTYFKPYDLFYRNLFVTNNPKALTTNERNVRIFLLIVANVDDPKIGPADRKNMYDAIAFFGKIKQFLGIGDFIYDTITGKRLTKQNVENAIKTFYAPAGPNDIVVFYYNGHGFRKPTDGRPGPYIDLKDKNNWRIMEASASLEDIYATIRKKRARLSLVLGDCCNALITDTNPLAEPPAVKKTFGINWSTENCRNLFLNSTPMSILGAAASPSMLAASNNNFGGFFSYFFRTSVETHFSFAKTAVSWDQVFKQTAEQTKYKADRTYCDNATKRKCNQLPYYRIERGRF
ncbi:MAG: caspase family protein [Ferruginibacter sp.]